MRRCATSPIPRSRREAAAAAKRQRSPRKGERLGPLSPLTRSVARARRNLELEQRAQRVHLHPIDVLDLVVLVFGADSDLPDLEPDADSVERVRPGLARRGPEPAG